MARLSLRLVVGGLCAVIVVVSAVVTLLITYSVALSTAQDIGTKYANSLAANARDQSIAYFSLPIAQCNASSRMYRQSSIWYSTPTNDPDIVNPDVVHLKYWNLHYQIMATADLGYASTTSFFADGSNHNIDKLGDVMILVSRLAINYPAQNMNLKVFAMNMTTYKMLNPVVAVPNYTQILVNYDYRTWGIWSQFISLFTALGDSMTYALPVTIGNRVMRLGGQPSLFVAFVGAVLDPATGQAKGAVSVSRELASISTFLRAVKAQATSNTQAFAVDGGGLLMGTTLSSLGFTTYVQPDNISRALPGNCQSDVDGRFDTTQPVTVGCRDYAAQYSAYPPLQDLGQNDPDALVVKTAVVQLRTLAGSSFFVASLPVNLPVRAWTMNVIVFLPEDDVIGSIITGRNTAIGATAGVCILAAIIAFTSVSLLLRPIRAVSRKMLATAKLHEAESETSESNLSEIQDLQTAFTNMSAAIHSFTRYVPRQVVKDLMRSGQLCEIRMDQLYCTMLFVDIAGFTTICERVPPDVLSSLVTNYFDRASRIVMNHDGLIDKFIGDCIMAVWGAPFATPNQEVKATLAGKLIDRETIVQPLVSQWDEAGEQLRVRVGISSGTVLAGNMGSDDRMSYTVIGDSVNLAARLESMNKQFGTRVMVSEMTAEMVAKIFVLRLLLPIAVVGKSEPVKVYEVMGMYPQVDAHEIDRLNENEIRVEKDTDSSAASTAGSATQRGKLSINTSTLLRDALTKTASECAIACSEHELLFAQRYTDVVHAYLRRDFGGALVALSKLKSSSPAYLFQPEVDPPLDAPRCTSCAAESLGMLEALCAEYANHCPDDFDGVYRAEHK